MSGKQNHRSLPRGRALVIGIGNEYRGDDAIGLVVARRLSESSSGEFTVIEHDGDGAALMEAWQGADMVIAVDAVYSDGEPGTVYRWDAGSQTLQGEAFRGSTHAFSLAEAVELSRTLHRLPPSFVIYGIEGCNFQAGAGVSAEVVTAVPDVVDRILLEMRGLAHRRS